MSMASSKLKKLVSRKLIEKGISWIN